MNRVGDVAQNVTTDNRYAPHEQLSEAARRVTVPTMLVRGGASDVVSEQGARELNELIPHAVLVDVAGAGHMVAGDRNDRFNLAVGTFLNDTVRPQLKRA